MDAKNPPKETSAPRPELLRLASEVRSQTNRMTDEQREASLRYGMQLIYGGPTKHAVPAKAGRH